MLRQIVWDGWSETDVGQNGGEEDGWMQGGLRLFLTGRIRCFVSSQLSLSSLLPHTHAGVITQILEECPLSHIHTHTHTRTQPAHTHVHLRRTGFDFSSIRLSRMRVTGRF